MAKIRGTTTRGGDGMVLSVRTRKNFNSIPKRRGVTWHKMCSGSVLIKRGRKDHGINARKKGSGNRSLRKRNENGGVIGAGIRNYTSVQRKSLVAKVSEDVVETSMILAVTCVSREGKIPFCCTRKGSIKEQDETRAEVWPVVDQRSNLGLTIESRIWKHVPVPDEKVEIRKIKRKFGSKSVQKGDPFVSVAGNIDICKIYFPT